MRTPILTLAAFALAGTLTGHAQSITDQDKAFLKDTQQDSNYEIKTSQLVLQKSKSDDLRAYATMLIHDHTALKAQTLAADRTVMVKPESAGSMSVSDDAEYLKLKILTGKTFEDSYIKTLISGNQDAVQKTKAEADGSTVPAVKKLAQHRQELDTKHTEKAKQLAVAHGVSN
jgi:putative membrane protein